MTEVKNKNKRTVGSEHIVTAGCDMYRADGTHHRVRVIYNGLKPVVTKFFGPAVHKSVILFKMKIEKVFKLFLTTKPAGQGTGFGLSLSYDIVKAHGGEIQVKTKVGEGAEFTIQLPINN